MIELTESSTFDDVVKAISAGGVNHFAEIPIHIQSGSIAREWLKYHLDRVSCTRFHDYYVQVPVSCRDDKFLWFASIFINVLHDTDPHQCNNYLTLVEHVTIKDKSAINLVPFDLREAVLEALYVQRPREMHAFSLCADWMVDSMSEDLFERCCHSDLDFAIHASPVRRRKDLCQYVDFDWFYYIDKCRGLGRLDLLAERFELGDWFGSGIISSFIKRPDTFDSIMNMLSDAAIDRTQETICMAFLINHPIDQVVSAMAESRLKKLLLEIYSREALAPFVKSDAGLRGAMLEEAIGL